MRIRDILQFKGGDIVSIAPERTVLEAMRLLVERNIGSVLVLEEGRLLGILTDRDVLRITSSRPGDFGSLPVSRVMSVSVLTCAPVDDIQHVMDVMTRNRVRHLPVTNGDELLGLVSIGDVVNALRHSVQTENEHLKQYIQGQVY